MSNPSNRKAINQNRLQLIVILSSAVVILFFIAIVIFYIYAVAIEPLVKFSSSEGRTTYTGKDLYVEEVYLQYDKGNEFKNAVSQISFIDQCEVLEFTYHDYACADTIGYSNYPDYYILEVDIQSDFSSAYKDSKDACLQSNRSDDYDILLMKTFEDESKYDHLYIAFSEQYERCFIIYRTDTPNEDSDARLISRDCLPDKIYYTKDDFSAIVIGESTYYDVNDVAPMKEIEITSEGGFCEYPMKHGGSVRITFVGKDLVVHSIEEVE